MQGELSAVVGRDFRPVPVACSLPLIHRASVTAPERNQAALTFHLQPNALLLKPNLKVVCTVPRLGLLVTGRPNHLEAMKGPDRVAIASSPTPPRRVREPSLVSQGSGGSRILSKVHQHHSLPHLAITAIREAKDGSRPISCANSFLMLTPSQFLPDQHRPGPGTARVCDKSSGVPSRGCRMMVCGGGVGLSVS